MSDLVVIAFDTEEKAEEVRERLLDLQKTHIVRLADAVIATKRPSGRVRLNQLASPATSGALAGGFWGLLIGLIFLNPLLGAALGAGAGALSGRLNDIGLNDKMMRDIAQSFKPGSSGLFVLVRKATVDKVLAGLKGFAGKGTVFQTSLTKDDEADLREALEAGLPVAG